MRGEWRRCFTARAPRRVARRWPIPEPRVAVNRQKWPVAYAHVFDATAMSRLPYPNERERAWRDALAAPPPGDGWPWPYGRDGPFELGS